MKSSSHTTYFWMAMVLAGTIFLAQDGLAQYRSLSSLRGNRSSSRSHSLTSSRDEGKVKIERFPASGKAALVRTPEYQVNVSGLQAPLSSRKREWAVFEIKYATSARWTDELAFTYHVLCKGKDEKGKDCFSYYTTTVRYMDIPRGSHMSCVMLPPSLVERYGEPLALALEIMGKDEAMGTREESMMSLPKGWWKNSKVMDDPRLVRRNGLRDRSKTPFALINSNDYEVVQ